MLIQEKNAPVAPCLAWVVSLGAGYQAFHFIVPEEREHGLRLRMPSLPGANWQSKGSQQWTKPKKTGRNLSTPAWWTNVRYLRWEGTVLLDPLHFSPCVGSFALTAASCALDHTASSQQEPGKQEISCRLTRSLLQAPVKIPAQTFSKQGLAVSSPSASTYQSIKWPLSHSRSTLGISEWQTQTLKLEACHTHPACAVSNFGVHGSLRTGGHSRSPERQDEREEASRYRRRGSCCPGDWPWAKGPKSPQPHPPPCPFILPHSAKAGSQVWNCACRATHRFPSAPEPEDAHRAASPQTSPQRPITSAGSLWKETPKSLRRQVRNCIWRTNVCGSTVQGGALPAVQQSQASKPTGRAGPQRVTVIGQAGWLPPPPPRLVVHVGRPSTRPALPLRPGAPKHRTPRASP